MFRILHQADREGWLQLLAEMGANDVFLQPDYLKLNERILPGEVECFTFYDGKIRVIYPYIRRRIPGTGWFDITSAYGYGGYVAHPRNTDASAFHSQFCDYCRSEGIVSEFIRFHPAFENHLGASVPSLHIRHHQPIVHVDYTESGFSFTGTLRKEVWKKIRKANQHGVTVIADTAGRYYQDFLRLYQATMDLRNAASFYYFDHDFIREVWTGLNGRSILFAAIQQDRFLGGLLVLYGPSAGYNFLSCSDYEFNKVGTNELLQYTALEWGQKHGLDAFFLGGGRGGEDSLFEFKAKFSTHRRGFYLGCRIHLPEVYDQLSSLRGVDAATEAYALPFPLYRREAQTI